MTYVSVFILAILSLPAFTQNSPLPQTTSTTLTRLDQFVPLQMQKWKVPGLAISVVQNGQIIYSLGFGRRNIKNNLPVTTQTIFAIGSITKSFTSKEFRKDVNGNLNELIFFQPDGTSIAKRSR